MQSKDIQNLQVECKRIKWSCRRGMLELDVLLGNFFEEAFENLALTEKHNFIKLLTYPDPDLFGWMLQRVEPEDEGLIHIIALIRKHAKFRLASS